MDVRFKTPANFYICGQSQSGKSYLVRSMLRNLEELFFPIPSKVLYCYGEFQKEFDELSKTLPNVQFVQGFPSDLYDMTEAHDNSLVILDDLMSQCSNDQRVADLFTRGSHHRGISVLFLTQNLFPPGKLSRTISLNSHYMIIFRNPRDSLGIATLARQMYPKNADYLLESFNDATKRPYGYLLLDLHQLTPEDIRLRTNILPNERQIVYVKRNS
jgi:hypothetical protein